MDDIEFQPIRVSRRPAPKAPEEPRPIPVRVARERQGESWPIEQKVLLAAIVLSAILQLVALTSVVAVGIDYSVTSGGATFISRLNAFGWAACLLILLLFAVQCYGICRIISRR